MAYKKLKYWFDKELIDLLSYKISQVWPAFPTKVYRASLAPLLKDEVELKERVALFADKFRECLPDDYKKAVDILLRILGPPLETEEGMFTEGYWLMPVAFFVEKYGLDDYDTSVEAVHAITQRHTGEYTVRPFLERYPQQMLQQMLRWSKDHSFHVRRLSSEGVRPRLPWHRKLQQYIEDPAPVLPILENLKADPSRYVQKSVANCINDILKDNPETAYGLLESWTREAEPATQWIIRHALRNERKKRVDRALAIMSNLL